MDFQPRHFNVSGFDYFCISLTRAQSLWIKFDFAFSMVRFYE